MRVVEKKLVILEIGKGFFGKLDIQQEIASSQELYRWSWRESDDLFIRCNRISPEGTVSLELFRTNPIEAKDSDKSKITTLVVSKNELKDLEKRISEQCKRNKAAASEKEINESLPLKTIDLDNMEIRIVADGTCEYERY